MNEKDYIKNLIKKDNKSEEEWAILKKYCESVGKLNEFTEFYKKVKNSDYSYKDEYPTREQAGIKFTENDDGYLDDVDSDYYLDDVDSNYYSDDFDF